MELNRRIMIFNIALVLSVSAFAQAVSTTCTCSGFIVNGKLLPLPVQAPLVDGRISSQYGMRMHPLLHCMRMHWGVDISAPTGTPIYALADGVVEEAEYRGGYGNVLRIRHEHGLVTLLYAHLSGFADGIYPGARVRQSEILAYVGATGWATGPHLHLEISRNGIRVPPECRCRPVPVHKAPGRRPARVA